VTTIRTLPGQASSRAPAQGRRPQESRLATVRRVPLVAVMMALVAAVLAVSLWIMRRAGQESLRAFSATQSELAKDTAVALHGYLDSFDRDTRLLAELAQGTRRQSVDRSAQDRAILDAFQALATVVPHYRTIELFSPGREPIVAVDPTEDRLEVAPALVQASIRVARRALRRPGTAFEGPVTLAGHRSFYLYAASAAGTEAVVVTADAAMMLEVVSRAPSGSHRLVVRDPSGAVWLGCEQRERCRLFGAQSDETAELMQTIQAASSPGPAKASSRMVGLGLPDRVVAGHPSAVPSPLGAWSVTLIGSAADIDLRQGAFLWQLVLTSMGIAAAMLTVGLFILRQHATAAALGARLQAAQEVATLQKQLVRAEKLVTVGVLSAGIAHEVGTPLMVIRGRAEHLLESTPAGPVAEDLESIIAQIDRISSTIRQVLEFSREQPIAVGSVDPAEAIGRALELLDWRVNSKQIAARVVCDDVLPPIAAAPDQFEQVAMNLLMNACDASEAGGAVEVKLARDPEEAGNLRLEIRDHGVGIPPESLHAVFDPYFTTKKRGEGTGLGLAIVSQIVRSHGGRVSLRSAPGSGTTATVLWPFARVEGARAQA
jgi:signal transduction histidine kinase